MDLTKLTQAKQVYDLTTQLNQLQQTLDDIQSQLDALKLTQDDIDTLIILYQQVAAILK